MATEQNLRERTGAGDYLGTPCQACGKGEYGLPYAPAGTDPGEARRILGEGVERDPGDGSWVVYGVVWCPLCNDKRPRWVSDGAVAELREIDRQAFIGRTALDIYNRLAEETTEAGMLTILCEALEANWGPVAEVVDAIGALDEKHGTPLWGHPFWAASLTAGLGSVAFEAMKLKHPGAEFQKRLPGELEEVEFEPPAAGAELLRELVIVHAAHALRWVIAIDERQKKEDGEQANAERVMAQMLKDVHDWSEMAQGRLTFGDDEEGAKEAADLLRRGRKHWISLSSSLMPGCREGLASIGIEPATPEQCELIAAELEPERQAEPEEATSGPAIEELLEIAKQCQAEAERQVRLRQNDQRAHKVEVAKLKKDLAAVKKKAAAPRPTTKQGRRARKKAHKAEGSASPASDELPEPGPATEAPEMEAGG